jgi:hypothetical protein
VGPRLRCLDDRDLGLGGDRRLSARPSRRTATRTDGDQAGRRPGRPAIEPTVGMSRPAGPDRAGRPAPGRASPGSGPDATCRRAGERTPIPAGSSSGRWGPSVGRDGPGRPVRAGLDRGFRRPGGRCPTPAGCDTRRGWCVPPEWVCATVKHNIL